MPRQIQKMSLQNILRKNIDRRKFSEISGKAALTIGGGLALDSLLSSCATVGFKEEAPVIYPPLKGHKVQPPEHGCFLGARYAISGFSHFIEKPRHMEIFIRRYSDPKIFAILHDRMSLEVSSFPWYGSKNCASLGAIPHVYAEVGKINSVEDIAKGKSDRGIGDFAGRVREFGEEFGGLFITTMREMNDPSGKRRAWKGKSSKLMKNTWRRIWEIFENAGANEYATWVWQVITPESFGLGNMRDPEPFYPGDKYVDWVGLSAYSAPWNNYRSFQSIAAETHKKMRLKHPQKPIMMAEFGAKNNARQTKWLKKAFEDIESWPGMKAAIYWDHVDTDTGTGFDHRLTYESLELFKEMIKNEYFVGAE